ncbi:MAG: tRNA lysidine(34) synthetase TilS [Woeseiaceae bacterium]
MTFNSEALYLALHALSKDAEPPQRYVVAFSGGLDSTVLLHALASSAARHEVGILAVHIDHGLQADSDKWAEQCMRTAADFDVEFHQERVSVDLDSGKGQEAAARNARYAALEALMASGDWLLSAHHQEDQAETLLLNLLRGSGPAGLAGIASIRAFAGGWLARPLLSFSQSSLREYALAHELSWIDDPSNNDRAFDRNFLRHEVLPIIESRWPGAAQRLYRSSRIASDSAVLLDELGAIDLAMMGGRCDRLHLDALKSLTAERQRNVLRFAIRELGLAPPSAAHLQRVLDEVVLARVDAEPVLTWGDVEIRRFRNGLYIQRSMVGNSTKDVIKLGQNDYQELGEGLGALRLERDAARGLDGRLLELGLELRFRQGGEKIRPLDQPHTKTLKNLLQEESVVPWMRDRIPLLYAGDKLVAVADIWLAKDAVSSPGVAIHWENRPPIH